MRTKRKARNVALAASNTAPVTDILGRVAAELRQAALVIDRTPVCTEHVKHRIGAEDSEYLRAMQGLDHSAQMLAGLADFLSALADRAPAHWRIDPHPASQVVTLAELASRLSLQASQVKGEGSQGSNGDCEFF
jgi:hypothetical protein